MITALMTAAVVWCLFSGRVPPPLLVPLSAAAGAAFGAAARHGHESVLSVDALAQASRLNTVNPGLKFWSALALMCLCVASGSPVPGLQPINKVRSARLGWAQILCRGEQKPKGKSSVDVE